ncbi:MAG: hypothetical protein KJ067_19015 [Vicinamibacteria bacterium]|nr:hypothetical protein [Vicinamibacteria bacterium]
MTAFFLAATATALVDFVRRRDWRVLPLVALFACLAAAHSREWWDPWRDRFHYAAGICGLALLLTLGRPAAAAPAPGPADPP